MPARTLKALTARFFRRPRPARPGTRARLALEPLGDRALPAGFVYTYAAPDSAPGLVVQEAEKDPQNEYGKAEEELAGSFRDMVVVMDSFVEMELSRMAAGADRFARMQAALAGFIAAHGETLGHAKSIG